MADLYSRRFITAPSFSGGPGETYTVPDGYLAVVKAISIVWGDITVSGLDAWVQQEDLTKLARYTWATGVVPALNLGGTAQWWGMWAVDPGEAIQVQTASGTCDFHVSGYLLAMP